MIRSENVPKVLKQAAWAYADQYADSGGIVLIWIDADIAAEDAILRQARLGRHNLIVMGVTCRPAATLTFGTVATAVLDSSQRSLLYVVS